MPFINLFHISPQQLNQSLANFKMTELANLFAPGEVLDAVVDEKLGDQKVVLMLKGQSIVADTEVPLKSGEKISVKVEQLQPRVMLRIIEDRQPETARFQEAAKIREYLMLHRSDPEALTKAIGNIRDHLAPQTLNELAGFLNRDDLQAIRKLLDGTVFVKASTANPDFVKEFVATLGLQLENNLLKILKETTRESAGRSGTGKEIPGKGGQSEKMMFREIGDNLKGQLMKLSQDISGLLEKKEMTGGALQQLTRTFELSNAAIKSLETHQVVNAMLQGNDNRYLLQIPFFFQDGLRTAELYIEKDGNPERPDKSKKQFRVVFFLDMDAIGKVMIDASFREQTIGCVVKCENEGIRDFATKHLATLGEKLVAQGYQVEYMTCMVEKDVQEEKRQYVATQSLYSQEMVNLFA